MNRRKPKMQRIAWHNLLLRALLCVCLLLASFGTSERVHADVNVVVSTETRAGRLAVFDDVWTTVRARYYDPSWHGVDWPVWGATLRPQAVEARTQSERFGITNKCCATLGFARLNTPE